MARRTSDSCLRDAVEEPLRGVAMRRIFWSMLAVCSLGLPLSPLTSPASAAVLTFDYTGFVLYVFDKAFGTQVDLVSPVAGHFTVETSAPATHFFDDGRIGYRQSAPSGFQAVVGNSGAQIDVVASEYLAIVGNDMTLMEGNGTRIADSFEIVFANNFAPQLASPLVANGAAVERGDYNQDGVTDALDYAKWKASFGPFSGSADGNGDWSIDAADYTIWRDGGPGGYFSVEFQNDAHDRFSSASLTAANLATGLTLGPFKAGYCAVGDNHFQPGVLFAISGLTLRSALAAGVPEPNSWILVLVGATSCLCLRPRNHRA
jgi:hypothetical protein